MKRRYNNLIIAGFIIGVAFLAVSQSALAQSYEFKVEHRHLLRNCQGTLIIDRDRIEYQTEHKKDARVWRSEDMKRIEIVSPTAINLVTYEDQGRFFGAERTFEFKLLGDEITQEVSHFLLSRVKRPLVTSVIPDIGQPPMFEIPVKHRHTLGGCGGLLRIYPEAVVYESREPEHSRYWRYSDIQQIGRLSRYWFEITTFEDQIGGPDRVFNFELKHQMDDMTYDYLWARVNQMQSYPYDREQPSNVTPMRSTTQAMKEKPSPQKF